jgi:probable F420-dependent oxidoreductase
MEFGAHYAPVEGAADVRDVGRLLETSGFESLFLPEHTHIPVTGDSIHPSGAHMHDRLARLFDPIVSLTAVAVVTTRLRLGTGVLLIPEHDPILLAKQVSTLDVLSGGRVLLGIGAGWNAEEMWNHGSDPAQRFTIMRERVEAMRRIWTAVEAEFQGQHLRFSPIRSWPKPVQHPHPPILVGGEGPRVLQRVLSYGDEWAPNAEQGIPERIAELQGLGVARGRATIPVTVMHVDPTPQAVRLYAEAGATRCVFTLPSAPLPQVAATVARLTKLIDGSRSGEP